MSCQNTSKVYRKHPHGRGENAEKDLKKLEKSETPPRAWGKPLSFANSPIRLGNTPTGVGKTPFDTSFYTNTGKHPHGRGENGKPHPGVRFVSETPPRAWGKRNVIGEISGLIRNTPTGVGKTARFERGSNI